jgi:hypothetical protein
LTAFEPELVTDPAGDAALGVAVLDVAHAAIPLDAAISEMLELFNFIVETLGALTKKADVSQVLDWKTHNATIALYIFILLLSRERSERIEVLRVSLQFL